MQSYLERDIKHLGIFLYEPFYPLSVGDLGEIVESAGVLDGIDEYLEEDKPVIEISALSGSEAELRDDFKAIGVENSEMVQNLIEIFLSRICTVVLNFIIAFIGIGRDDNFPRDVKPHKCA